MSRFTWCALAVLLASPALAQDFPARDGAVRRGQPDSPTYEGGYEGFGRFGDYHGYRGFGVDTRFRGGTTRWSDRTLAIPSGAIGLGYGLSMGPYQGAFEERYGYPEGGGRSAPTGPEPME